MRMPFCMLLAVSCLVAVAQAQDGGIVHDAEFALLEAQNGEKWEQDDKAICATLADLREKNGGKPPNIVYILLDDLGFGEIGMPNMSVVRGYKTPRISLMFSCSSEGTSNPSAIASAFRALER